MATEITEVKHQERAVEMSADSKQPRFTDKEVSDFYISIMNWMNNEIENEPEYSPKSRTRDKWLSEVWMLESHLAGVVNSVVSIDKNRGWTLVGGRNQVNKYTKILHNFVAAPNLFGWRNGTSVSSLSYYVTDVNSIIEIGRDGRNGPLRQLFCVDPTLCELTDDMDYPLSYFPPGKSMQRWEILDFMRCASLPDMREEYNGLGHCALSRCIELTKLMVAVYEHDREELGSKAPRGLLLLEGIDQKQWNSAMLVRQAKEEGLEHEYFSNVGVLASGGNRSIDAKLIALSNLPKNFDLQAFTSMLMYGYALCFGYDPSEFYPVQFGSLGRGTEMEIQHEKATVKGKLDYAYAFQENLQGEIPPTLEFLFDERDDSGDLTLANVQKTHAETVASMRNTGPGDLSAAEARQLWAEYGLIPREWTEVEEDVEIEDTDAPEVTEEEDGDVEAEDTESTEEEERRFERLRRKRDRDRLLSNIRVRSAAETFPREPIIEYSWPQKRVNVLAESGYRLLAPPRSYHFISRAVLYEEDDVEITDKDVEKAIEEGEDRMGAEFKSLLLGEPPPEERNFLARILKRQSEEWFWDSSSFRYVNSAGSVFPQAQMKAMLTESIQLSSEYLNNISNQYANGNITRTQFIDGMRLELKNEYIRQYMLGRGGYGQMTYADWGSVGGSLADQYRYIDGFADDLLAGKLSPGQIETRSGMYSNSAREAYSKGKDKVVRAWGADEEAWQNAAFSDTCVDCVDFQDEGWQSIGHFPMPGDGSTVCLCILSPESKILTWHGWIPLLDVEVGDEVFTHRRRWRKVKSLLVKPSAPFHKFAMLGKVACTSNHRWMTSEGWMSIDDIRNSYYNISHREVLFDEAMSELQYRFTSPEQARPLLVLQEGLSLRESQRSAIQRMPEVHGKNIEFARQGTMVAAWSKDEGVAQNSRSGKAHPFQGFGGVDLADQEGRAALELVLETRRGNEKHDLSLSMGMDNGAWIDPGRVRDPSFQRESIGRPLGESLFDGTDSAFGRSCQRTRQQQTHLGLFDLREGFQILSQGRHARPEILLGGLLSSGTAVYDIEVEEDHSFCIEGYFAHNTNCHCNKSYRNSKTGEEYEE